MPRHLPPTVFFLAFVLAAGTPLVGCATTAHRAVSPASAASPSTVPAPGGGTAAETTRTAADPAGPAAPAPAPHRNHGHQTWGWLGGATMIGMMALMVAL